MIGEVIGDLIKGSGKTTKEIAHLCGVPEQTLYAMVKAKTDKVSLSGLNKIAELFGKKLEYFLNPDEYQEPIDMTANERVLLTTYRRFNSEGKKKLEEYVKDLGESGRYTRN